MKLRSLVGALCANVERAQSALVAEKHSQLPATPLFELVVPILSINFFVWPCWLILCVFLQTVMKQENNELRRQNKEMSALASEYRNKVRVAFDSVETSAQFTHECSRALFFCVCECSLLCSLLQSPSRKRRLANSQRCNLRRLIAILRWQSVLNEDRW